MKGQENELPWFRVILSSSLASSLQGPDGILNLPWETGLGFACHQQGIQTSARTLTLSPSPISLASQAVQVIMAFVCVSSILGTMFENYESVQVYYV